ncbi:hypothetical protein XENORESO_013464 [Xenotaenia resolanae]|uniref:Uncharacterized protein n=1 Tax=Xenotaenia resolanae TaxID=208358 RepID=A0ABV0WLM4_9TELE
MTEGGQCKELLLLPTRPNLPNPKTLLLCGVACKGEGGGHQGTNINSPLGANLPSGPLLSCQSPHQSSTNQGVPRDPQRCHKGAPTEQPPHCGSSPEEPGHPREVSLLPAAQDPESHQTSHFPVPTGKSIPTA